MPRDFAVLLVEDDDPLRGCLAELLAARGWRVYPVGDGHAALELARCVQLDFSIMDMHLPGISGLEVLETIQHEIQPLPSIMMSGKATPEEATAALDLGAFTFLRKPLDLSDLRLTMERLIRHHFGSSHLPG